MLKDVLLTGWLLGTALTAAFFGTVLLLAWLKNRREYRRLKQDGWSLDTRGEAKGVDPMFTAPEVDLSPLLPHRKRTMHDAPRQVDVPNQPRRNSREGV